MLTHATNGTVNCLDETFKDIVVGTDTYKLAARGSDWALFMTWMMTGGAGYIGAHVVRALQEARMSPVVLVNVATGHHSFMPDMVPFIEAYLNDTGAVLAALVEHGVTGVIHVAVFKYAGFSEAPRNEHPNLVD